MIQYHPTTLAGQRPSDHRGRARRGRAPLQRAGRALHGEVRAEQDGAGLARRRLARRADRDQRGPRLPRRHRRARHHGRAAQAHPRGAARDRRTWAATSPAWTSRSEPIHIKPGNHYVDGRREDRRRRPDRDPGPLRRRRVRLRVGPRRQPARRELAARHARLRPPLRRATPRERAPGRRAQPAVGRRCSPTRSAGSASSWGAIAAPAGASSEIKAELGDDDGQVRAPCSATRRA